MQAELEKWIEENSRSDWNSSFNNGDCIPVSALRALLADKVLCDAGPAAYVYSDNPGQEGAFSWRGKQRVPLYAPASLAGNADVGTMRIVAIQGAAEEYARQGNAVLANELRDKFGKEGGE